MASYVYMYVLCVCVGALRACGFSEFEGGMRFWSILEWRVMCGDVCGGVFSAGIGAGRSCF